MKQQYTILKNLNDSRLIIREFGELDKDSLSLLCEESYDDAVVSDAVPRAWKKSFQSLEPKICILPEGMWKRLPIW